MNYKEVNSVGTFGIVTTLTYAVSGKIDLLISAFFILGGIGGGWLGARKITSVQEQSKNHRQFQSNRT